MGAVEEEDDIQEVTPVKSEPAAAVEPPYEAIEPQGGAVALDDTYQDETYDYGAFDDVNGSLDPSTGMPYADGNKDLEIKSKMQRCGGEWHCVDCSYSSKLKNNVYKHVESKHVEPQIYQCIHCGKALKGMNSYNVHIYT